MLIDLSCPAEIFQTTLPTEGIPAVSMVMYNLSDRIIVSVEVTARLLNGNNAERDRVTYRARALNGRPHSTFTVNVPCNADSTARRADVVVDKVWFNDNAVWRREASSSVEYTPNTLPVSKGLTNLKFAAGETAVGYPSQQDGLWVCVCGRPNPDKEEICARCRRQKEMIFTRFSREAVEKQVSQREKQLDLNTRNVREDTARMQRIREEEYNKKKEKKHRRIRLAVSLVLCLALTAVILSGGAPGLRLWSASRAMQEENWQGAADTLASLGDFPGARERLAECRRALVLEQAAKAKTEKQLRAAADALRSLPEEEEITALAEQTELALGRKLLEKGKTAEAREAVAWLPEDNAERVALENDCLFAEAKVQLEAGAYTAAREAFLSLGSYPGAADLAAECVYRPALILIEEGEYDAAILELNRIPAYPGSREKTLECHYRKAQIAEELGDLAEASAEYLMAGDYEDAEAKTRETVFLRAEALYADGEIEEARKLFASLPGDPAAVERNNECLYLLAQQALTRKEYEEALEMLSAMTGEYANSLALISRAAYLAGVNAEKKKDWALAAERLEKAGDYRDAPKRLQNALEQLARERLEAGDPEGARELIARIPESKSYDDLLKEADYLSAIAAAEAGEDPEDCRQRFEELGNYKEAETWVLRMYYAMAEQAAARGEALSAAALYEKAGKWSDAAEKAEAQYDAYYGERAAAARDAAENEDYTLAVTILETVSRENLPAKYADLDDLYESSLLNAGIQLFRDGRPYEAAVYFQAVSDPRKAERWLNSTCYTIPGTWVNRAGEVIAVFREDSSCEIAGESFTFLVPDSFTILTAPPEGGEMTATFRISNLTKGRMTMRDMRADHAQSWDLFRQTDDVNEEITETDGEEDFEVKDGE